MRKKREGSDQDSLTATTPFAKGTLVSYAFLFKTGGTSQRQIKVRKA